MVKEEDGRGHRWGWRRKLFKSLIKEFRLYPMDNEMAFKNLNTEKAQSYFPIRELWCWCKWEIRDSRRLEVGRLTTRVLSIKCGQWYLLCLFHLEYCEMIKWEYMWKCFENISSKKMLIISRRWTVHKIWDFILFLKNQTAIKMTKDQKLVNILHFFKSSKRCISRNLRLVKLTSSPIPTKNHPYIF